MQRGNFRTSASLRCQEIAQVRFIKWVEAPSFYRRSPARVLVPSEGLIGVLLLRLKCLPVSAVPPHPSPCTVSGLWGCSVFSSLWMCIHRGRALPGGGRGQGAALPRKFCSPRQHCFVWTPSSFAWDLCSLSGWISRPFWICWVPTSLHSWPYIAQLAPDHTSNVQPAVLVIYLCFIKG